MTTLIFRVSACIAAVCLPFVAQAESLAQAVRATLASNPAIEAATHETRASAYELLQLKSEYQPVVTAFADAGVQRVDDPVSLSPDDNDETKFSRELGLDVNWVLFDGYRRANLIYSNAARVDANIYRLLDASETMALNATEVYIDVVRHLRLQQAAQRNVARDRDISRRVRELVDGGRLPVSDRLQADDRTRAAELALIDVRRAGRDAEARYQRIIGHKRKGPVSITLARGLPRSLDALTAAALKGNHRVRVASIEAERMDFERAIVNSDRSPQLSLNAGVRRGWDIDGVSGTEDDAHIGFRLRWELHRGGRTERDKALIERKRKALAERHVAVHEMRELAARSWNSYLSNSERSRVLAGQLAANRSLIEQFEEEFSAGKRTLLDMLEAERATFDVEFQKISADASLAFSSYRLIAAQSRLASYFGAKPAGAALVPDFSGARASKTRIGVSDDDPGACLGSGPIDFRGIA